jgi:hypothetical protein
VVPLQDAGIAPGCAMIEGRVLGEAGQPLAGAKVYSMVIDHPPRGRLLSTMTDAEGKFSLKCAEPGKNGVYVSKEEDGYPDSLVTPFLERSLIPVVDAPDQKAIAGVEVHAPPKSGRLSGRVINSKTMESIAGAALRFCRVDDPGNCYPTRTDSRGEFSLLMPPPPFTIQVSAQGYEESHYRKPRAGVDAQAGNPGDQTDAGPPAHMRVRPLETTSIVVPLRPVDK